MGRCPKLGIIILGAFWSLGRSLFADIEYFQKDSAFPSKSKLSTLNVSLNHRISIEILKHLDWLGLRSFK